MRRSRPANASRRGKAELLATKNLAGVYEDLKETVLRAARDGEPIHEVEKAVWEQLLRLGREALTQIFTLLGNGATQCKCGGRDSSDS